MAIFRLTFCVVFSLIGSCDCSCLSTCTNSHIDEVARVVFGEAQGESLTGQIAVAYTIVNRVSHSSYPNSIPAVLSAKYGSNNQYHEYNTLDLADHDRQWTAAKSGNTAAYRNAIEATKSALCRCVSDPTDCGVAYCAFDRCSATDDNKYTEAYNKIQIGGHFFVCRRAIIG